MNITLLRPISALTLAVAALILTATVRPASAELLGGIEIGGSGAKAFLFNLEGNHLALVKDGKISTRAVAHAPANEPVFFGGTGVTSALSENVLASATRNLIVAQVKSLITTLKSKGVSDSNIFIAGSSSVEKLRNADELADSIFSETSLPVSFISPEQEGIFGLLDAISEESNPDAIREKSIFIDVGAGNVKFSYIERGEPYAFEVPFGTDNLADSDVGESGSCEGWKVQSCMLQPYMTTVADGMVRAFPRLRDAQAYPNVYFSGGTAWAVSRITQLEESTNRYSVLNFANFLDTLDHVESFEQILETRFATLRKIGLRNGLIDSDLTGIRKQAYDVVAYYGSKKSSLRNGISLYLWSLELVQRNRPTDTYKELNRPGNWIQYFVAYRKNLITEVKVPVYRPTVSRRSRDMER